MKNWKPLYATIYEGQTCVHFLAGKDGQNKTLSGCSVDLSGIKGKFDVLDITNVPFNISLQFVTECFNVLMPCQHISYKEYKKQVLENNGVLL